VIKSNGPLSYLVKTSDGREMRRHVDNLRARYENTKSSGRQGLKSTSGNSIQEKLSKFLLKYRITPHTTTGVPPAELLIKRRLRTKLDLLYPDVGKRVTQQQEKQKDTHDNSKALRTFKDGDLVYAENFNSSPR